MRMWLTVAVFLPLMATFPAHADPAGQRRGPARTGHSTASFLLPKVPQFDARPLLDDGLLAQEEVAPGAHVGLGLVPMSGRKIHSVRIEPEPVPTQNPGVTLIFKFRN